MHVQIIYRKAFLSMYTQQHGTLPLNILSLLINLELFSTNIGFLRSGIFFIIPFDMIIISVISHLLLDCKSTPVMKERDRFSCFLFFQRKKTHDTGIRPSNVDRSSILYSQDAMSS